MIIVFGEAKPTRQEVCRAERIEAKTDDYASVAVAVGIDINKAQIIPSLRPKKQRRAYALLCFFVIKPHAKLAQSALCLKITLYRNIGNIPTHKAYVLLGYFNILRYY